MRDIAALLDITERATQRIVAELADAGYIHREREGRRNLYSVKNHMPVGLPTPRDIDIESLLAILSHHDDTPTCDERLTTLRSRSGRWGGTSRGADVPTPPRMPSARDDPRPGVTARVGSDRGF